MNKSKRDEVWERKYAQWKDRNQQMSQQRGFGGGNGHMQTGGRIISGHGAPVLDEENQPLPWLPQQTNAMQQQHAPSQQQFVQQQQQQSVQQQQFGDSINGPRFGRRAPSAGDAESQQRAVVNQAPPGSMMASQQRQQQMMFPPQQQQQQQSVAGGSMRRGAAQQHRSTALW